MRILVKSGIVAALILCIMFMNSSCTHRNMYPGQTASMDSIVKVLHKVDSNLSKVDTVHIQKCIDHVFIMLEYLKMNNKDTVSRGASQIISSFNEVRWNLQTYLGRQMMIRHEIKISEGQLSHLSHDMKNNLVSKDSVMIFYNMEMKKAKELIETGEGGMKSLDIQLPMYDLIVPQADSILNRFKKHQAI